MLVLLASLTVGAWAFSVREAQTMDMPMGIAVEGIAGSSESSDAAGDMQNMPGMAMDNMGEMAVSGMSGMGWSWSGFLTFLFAWCVMMAAMMFPAAAPMVLFIQRVAARRMGERMVIVPVMLFTGAYLLVWAAIGVVTWVLIQAVSDIAARLGETDRERWAPVALGAVLIVGGLYQFTPLKAVCLRHCQSPVSFVMTHWREGYRGMLHMGITHGAYCLGCCWALFAVLVAAGVMSLAWMLLLTLVIFAEKVLPFGNRSAQASGAIFLLLGLFIAAGTIDLPWSA
jgi:predicted metal-binding membrane protein